MSRRGLGVPLSCPVGVWAFLCHVPSGFGRSSVMSRRGFRGCSPMTQTGLGQLHPGAAARTSNSRWNSWHSCSACGTAWGLISDGDHENSRRSAGVGLFTFRRLDDMTGRPQSQRKRPRALGCARGNGHARWDVPEETATRVGMWERKRLIAWGCGRGNG
jgi:hypothetical protein